ncbi:MAG: hypothetical protein HZB53_02555 [Chloroflexi bacterium]|nr:hypothetical protein [Chloroflexota bacterium]
MASVLLSANHDRVSVAPGSSVEFVVTIQNLTTLVDQVTLRVEGIDSRWVQMVPPVLPVFAQGTASARVIISPPAHPAEAMAGSYGVQVAGVSQERPGESAVTNVTLDVQLVGDYQLRLTTPQAGDLPQERRYPLRVINGANAVLLVHPSGQDRNGDFWYKFEPFQLTVPPGGEGTLVVTARAKQMTVAQRAVAFNVATTGTYTLRDGNAVDAAPRDVAGQFAQGALATLIVSVAPAQMRAPLTGIFQVRVGNPGPIPVNARLAVSEAAEGLSFRFNPEQVVLAPQSERPVSLSVRAAGMLAAGGAAHSYDFRVAAAATDGLAEPGAASAQFVQIAPVKPVPWALIIGLLTLALIACFAFAIVIVNNMPR